MNVKARATAVARIFDILSWVVLALGGLIVLVLLIASLSSSTIEVVVVALGAALHTVITWAGISLATVVAGNIAQRAE